jgi:hypothetical protein
MATSRNISNRSLAEQAKLDKKDVKKIKSPDLKDRYIVECFPRARYYFKTKEKRQYFIEHNIPLGSKYALIHRGKRKEVVR